MPGKRNRLLRLGFVLAVGSGVLGLAIFIAFLIVLPVFRFPAPGGPHAIGTLTYHLVDPNRAEIFSTDASSRRELMVQIWYPAKAAEPLSSTPPLTPPPPSPRAP